MATGSLRTYRKKRDFRHTPEPGGPPGRREKGERKEEADFCNPETCSEADALRFSAPGRARLEIVGSAEGTITESK